jgi:prepilin-type N-terminal cleavage/methylation domain-containing protein
MESAQGRRRSCGGFSLIELLLALALGLLLCGLVIQALAADGQGLQRLVRRQRQALLQRRLIELLRSELLRAER